MLKKNIITFIAVISIIFPRNSYAQNPYDNMSCIGWCILVPAYVVTSWWEGIGHLMDDISDSRTVSIKVNGVKAEFQRNSVKYNEKRKGSILEGKLLKETQINIRGKVVTLMPGEVTFFENGNICKCLIRESELLIGDNTTVNCSGDLEFYDDQFVKQANLSGDSGENGRMFNIQGKDRSLTGEIYFLKTGLVEQCILKSDSTFTIADYTLRLQKLTSVTFNSENKIVYIVPPYEKSIGIKFKGKFIKISDSIILFENGRLKSCVLSDALNIENGIHKVRVRGIISFYDNEMIEKCKITNPTPLKINGKMLEFEKDGTLSFYKNGVLKSGVITENKKQFYISDKYNIKLKDGSEISFYENGSLKSLHPYNGTEIKAGSVKFLLDDGSMRFYKEGGVLSLHCTRGAEFYYNGTKLYVNNFSDQLFFNREQELIAFNNDQSENLIVNGKPVFVPYYVKVSYADYDKKTVDYLMINYSQITLPPNVKIADTEYSEYAEIFVKAKDFFNDKNKDKLFANDVQEIMFAEDTIILINGKEHLCEAMTWFKIPVNN